MRLTPVDGGGSEDADVAAAEERLEQLADAGAGDAAAEEGVELLDDEDVLGVLHAAEAVDDRLEAQLDLATELGPSHQRPGVELEEARAGEVARHVAFGDAHREAADDGRLARAGLADDHRVVLEAPLEDLHQATDLGVATDDRIETILARVSDEIPRVGLGLALRAAAAAAGETLGRLVELVDVIAKAAGADGELGEDLTDRAADLLGQGVKELREADLVDVVALGFALGAIEEIEQSRADVGDVGGLGEPLEGALAKLHHHAGVGVRALEDRGDPGAALDTAGEQMQRRDLAVLVLVGELLRARYQLLGFAVELLEPQYSIPFASHGRGRVL